MHHTLLSTRYEGENQEGHALGGAKDDNISSTRFNQAFASWKISLWIMSLFDKTSIERSKVRRQTESIQWDERKKRNNVEASIFQYCFHARNNKTRYRGLIKHTLQAIARWHGSTCADFSSMTSKCLSWLHKMFQRAPLTCKRPIFGHIIAH